MTGNAPDCDCTSVPLLLFLALESEKRIGSGLCIRVAAASLTRSLFTGTCVVFRNGEMPLFRVERKGIEEVHVALALAEKTEAARLEAEHGFWFTLAERIRPEPRQWVVVAAAPGLALRNIDHLLPPELPGPYSPTPVDFLWAERRGPVVQEGTLPAGWPGRFPASPGLCAVRGEHLATVLDCWRTTWAEWHTQGEEAVWTRVVHGLDLRKRRFERGEVVVAERQSVSWPELKAAAYVMLPEWPEKEAWGFLQSLYLGTYFGDETGMFVGILDA